MAKANSVSITRKLKFEAGHRIPRHESKCKHLHGHSYVVHVTVEPLAADIENCGLDDLGRVLDFGILKSRLQTWLDESMDHTFLLDAADAQARRAFELFNSLEPEGGERQKVYFLPYPPTAENIARHLAVDVFPALVPEVNVMRVTVRETENCNATYWRESVKI